MPFEISEQRLRFGAARAVFLARLQQPNGLAYVVAETRGWCDHVLPPSYLHIRTLQYLRLHEALVLHCCYLEMQNFKALFCMKVQG